MGYLHNPPNSCTLGRVGLAYRGTCSVRCVCMQGLIERQPVTPLPDATGQKKDLMPEENNARMLACTCMFSTAQQGAAMALRRQHLNMINILLLPSSHLPSTAWTGGRLVV
ncbi:hypothetical protein XELAEV_18028706mg [Xenopus laevis]|uniref:Uncharacterized protein n=1 Tax=Xenopus laevis TaxID=8355 RepID=A0A974HGY5_XENLA|nr:hypothetical protein XELAEV_18028706mg [Xenopus laevis]